MGWHGDLYWISPRLVKKCGNYWSKWNCALEYDCHWANFFWTHANLATFYKELLFQNLWKFNRGLVADTGSQIDRFYLFNKSFFFFYYIKKAQQASSHWVAEETEIFMDSGHWKCGVTECCGSIMLPLLWILVLIDHLLSNRTLKEITRNC